MQLQYTRQELHDAVDSGMINAFVLAGMMDYGCAFEAAGSVPTMLTGSTDKIGVRMPGCLLARAICKRADVPLTATSANIAGRPPATTAGEIVAAFGNSLSLVLDCGKLSAEAGSTVVDVTSGAVTVIRQGAIAEERIRTVVGENALEN